MTNTRAVVEITADAAEIAIGIHQRGDLFVSFTSLIRFIGLTLW